MIRNVITVVLAAAIVLSLGVVEPVQAQNGGFFNNLFSGGQRGRDRRAAASAQRSENRDIQAALNFLEFDAGEVDGVFGQKTQTAVSAFQAALSFPVSGQLTGDEKSFLLASYDHMINGGEEMNWQILSNSEGALGVLKSLYLEDNPFAEITAEVADLTQPSMRAFCINIGASQPIDLVKAQFCNLRLLAIENANYLVESVQNPPDPAQVLEKCGALTAAMRPLVEQVVETPPADMLVVLADWTVESGMSPETLSKISTTCLGAGYRADNAEIALASVLALTGLKDPVFVELMAYHIAFGLGFEGEEDFSNAREWLENGAGDASETSVSLTRQSSAQRAEIVADIINILPR